MIEKHYEISFGFFDVFEAFSGGMSSNSSGEDSGSVAAGLVTGEALLLDGILCCYKHKQRLRSGEE